MRAPWRESAKAASDIYAPVSGEIVAVNDALLSDPGAGEQRTVCRWLDLLKIKASDESELESPLDMPPARNEA
ncbi:hypothetical protein KCP71_10995 [Salmonella enterica subsp. enterica]|nr:hypothetical protein KCP71_10995 [Salmonella enterica subsp. enterica]